MTETKKSDGLFAKLLAAQEAAQPVEKQGRNEDQNYKYARAEDVIKEAQRALHEAGLVGYVRPGEREVTQIQSQRGTAGLFVTVELALIIIDPETPLPEPDDEGAVFDSGTLILDGFVGTGVDYPGDKAIYKALTGGAKYAYASALGIPFGDDPEDSSSTSPEARETAKHSGAEATPAQKRTITRNLNDAGVPDDLKRKIVHGIAGDPPSKAGASEILDVLIPASKGESDLTVEQAVDELIERAGLTKPSDVPADESGLPPRPALDDVPPDDPPMEDDPDSLEARAERPGE